MNLDVPEIKVKKRGKRIDEPLNIEKIHEMVSYATEDLKGVSASQVEMSSGLQFYDGMTTEEIQQILIKSSADLISLEHPNYQYVAARLLLFTLRKKLFHRLWDHPHLYGHLKRCVTRGVYDKGIFSWYEKKDFDRMEYWLKHDRDYLFTYAGLRQVIDKYLVQDRTTGKVFETPQFMYMMIAATVFAKYPRQTRMTYVKKYYDAISTFKINIPTPVMAGVRTPMRQYASCVLIDVDDTLPSIFASDMAIGRYTAQRAGIGINVGRIRAINSRIRNGEVTHTGLIPFLKKFETTVKCCTQNGVRGGCATVHFPIWHKEIEDLIVLKNNKGTEDNRVRHLDYSVQISKLFYERFIKNQDITLFSPNDVPDLYEAYGTKEFDDLYIKYENSHVSKRKISAQKIFFDMLKERAETGRIYIMNIDHANEHSAFKSQVKMSNLCQEITLPTDPIQHIDGRGEIALCILSAINVGTLEKVKDLQEICDLSVRALDEIIDHQNYPVKAAEISTRRRRSLGIGYIGLAHYLARKGVKYNDKKAFEEVDKLTEAEERARDIGKELGLTFTSAFEDAVVEGKKFRDILQGIYKDLLRIMLRKTITEPVGTFLSDTLSAGVGALFPGKQFGGSVAGGKPHIVGEAGPELFVPGSSGSVVPNHQLGGGGSIVQNINVTTGVQQTVRAEIIQLMPMIRKASVEAVLEERSRGGQMAQAMGAVSQNS